MTRANTKMPPKWRVLSLDRYRRVVYQYVHLDRSFVECERVNRSRHFSGRRAAYSFHPRITPPIGMGLPFRKFLGGPAPGAPASPCSPNQRVHVPKPVGFDSWSNLKMTDLLSELK